MRVTINAATIRNITDISVNVTKYSTEVFLYSKERPGDENVIRYFNSKSNAIVCTLQYYAEVEVWVLVLSYHNPKIDIGA